MRTIADAVGLERWWIDISHDAPENPSSYATTFVPHATVNATMYFGDDFFTQSPEKQRWCVVHECLHLLDAERESVIFNSLKSMGALTSREWDLLSELYTCAQERFTDSVALQLAGKFALPALTGVEATE